MTMAARIAALRAALDAVPDNGQVPMGVGTWLQPLINAAIEVISPDHDALDDVDVPWPVNVGRHIMRCDLCLRPRAECCRIMGRPVDAPTGVVWRGCCDRCALDAFRSIGYGHMFEVSDPAQDRPHGSNACHACGAREGERCNPACATLRREDVPPSERPPL